MIRQHSRNNLNEIYRKLETVIKKHGKARVRLKNIHEHDYGTRIIEKNGMCRISYSGNRHYRRRYGDSCFFRDALYNCKYGKNGIKLSVKELLKQMRGHDGNSYIIAEVEYGPYFRSKMRLPEFRKGTQRNRGMLW